MAEEETLPEPNVVAAFTASIVAPVGLVHLLCRDVADAPRAYDKQTTYVRALARDRETKQLTSRQLHLQAPKVVVNHGFAESAVADVEVADPAYVAPEVAEGEEAPPVPTVTVQQGSVSLPVSAIGASAAELVECKLGGISFTATATSAGACALEVKVSLAAEGVDADFAGWCKALGGVLKNLAEKTAYLAPGCADLTVLRAVVAKAKGFDFIDVNLLRSPSAVSMLASGTAGGSLGYFADKAEASPITLGLATRPKA